jgi:hypothetical protein
MSRELPKKMLESSSQEVRIHGMDTCQDLLGMKPVIWVSSVQEEADSEVLMVLFVHQYWNNRARDATLILDSPCVEGR